MRVPTRVLLALIFPVLVLAGCGVRFAYQHLDWLVPWYVGDYVTLDPGQKHLLDTRLAQRLAWHCSSQLGPYADLLREFETRLDADAPIAPVELEHYLHRGEAFWRTLMTAITPDAGALLAGLSAEQVDELAAAFDKRNRDVREEFLGGTVEERRERQIERMEERLQGWFGRLEPEQRRLVAAWSANLVPTADRWLQNREQWQVDLLAALGQRTQPAFEAPLSSLLVTPEAAWPVQYRADVERNRALTLSLLAEVFNVANPAQREHLRGEVATWAGQFEQLACAPPPQAPKLG